MSSSSGRVISLLLLLWTQLDKGSFHSSLITTTLSISRSQEVIGTPSNRGTSDDLEWCQFHHHHLSTPTSRNYTTNPLTVGLSWLWCSRFKCNWWHWSIVVTVYTQCTQHSHQHYNKHVINMWTRWPNFLFSYVIFIFISYCFIYSCFYFYSIFWCILIVLILIN